jgi:hypothetical protein
MKAAHFSQRLHHVQAKSGGFSAFISTTCPPLSMLSFLITHVGVIAAETLFLSSSPKTNSSQFVAQWEIFPQLYL